MEKLHLIYQGTPKYQFRKQHLHSVIIPVWVGELLRNNGYAKLKDYGIVSDTLNDKKCGYGYSDGTTPEGDCGFAGVFSSEGSSEAAKRIKVSMDCNRIAVRASNFNGTWSSWRELSFK